MVTKIAGNDNFDSSSVLGNTGWAEVNTMGMLGDPNYTGTNRNAGDTVAGSTLTRSYSVQGFQYATITAPSGTWRIMGYRASGYFGTICVRIS